MQHSFQNCELDRLAAPTATQRLQNQTNATIASAPPNHRSSYAGISQSPGRSPPKRCVRVESRVRQREGEDTAASRYRRIDHISLDSMQREIHMYLDSVLTRDDSRNGGGVSTVDMAVHETFNILRSCWCSQGSLQDIFEPVRKISPVTLELLLNYGRHKLTDDRQYAVPRGGEDELPWFGCILAVLACYMQKEVDGNTAQRRTSLPPTALRRSAVHLLPRHAMRTTHNLCASNTNADNDVLLYPSTPLENEEECEGGTRVPRDVKEGSVEAPGLLFSSSAPISQSSHLPLAGVSRLLLLNCHNFGWLDDPGNEDYESSSRFLRKIDSALHKMMGPLPQTRLRQESGGDIGTGCLSSSALKRSCCTTVLLSDAILMDGGVPSLTVTQRCRVFDAHKQYGQGIACLVSPIHDQGQYQGSSLDANHVAADAFPTGATESREHCAMRASSASPQVLSDATHPIDTSAIRGNEEAALQSVDDCIQGTLAHNVHGYYNSNPSPPQHSVVLPFRVESPSSASFSTSLSTVSTSSSSAAGWKHYNCSNLRASQPWPPVSCGHRTAPGIVAQAVLLAPMGPLILHIQLERAATMELFFSRPSIASMYPHAYHDTSGAQQALSPTQPHPLPSPGATSHHNCESASFISTWETQEPALYDLAEWLLYLLQSPQPLLIVEWHLDRQQRDATNKDVAAVPDPRSAVLQLLGAYADHMSSSASPFGDVELRDAVHATCRSIRPCATGTKFDGRDRPVIFVRELKAVVEMEYHIDEEALITSLQYC